VITQQDGLPYENDEEGCFEWVLEESVNGRGAAYIVSLVRKGIAEWYKYACKVIRIERDELKAELAETKLKLEEARREIETHRRPIDSEGGPTGTGGEDSGGDNNLVG